MQKTLAGLLERRFADCGFIGVLMLINELPSDAISALNLLMLRQEVVAGFTYQFVHGGTDICCQHDRPVFFGYAGTASRSSEFSFSTRIRTLSESLPSLYWITGTWFVF